MPFSDFPLNGSMGRNLEIRVFIIFKDGILFSRGGAVSRKPPESVPNCPNYSTGEPHMSFLVSGCL